MYVYLRHGNLIKRFLDADLVDCVQPQVDGFSVQGTDPTVWFKVLILDSILVDCDGREVYWNKEPVVEATTIHWTKDEDLEVAELLPFYQTQGKMFESGCHDFVVDVDELFESARSVVEEMEHSVADFMDNAELEKLKESVFRLLHMFILPKLRLRKNDLKDLRTVLPLIEQYQKDLEMNIVTKEKIKYRTGRFLEKQRLCMLTNQDFTSERVILTFNYDFLQHFLKHLEADISAGNENMLAYDEEISPLRTCQTIQEQEMLNYWRDKRDQTWAHINKAVAARETIKNVIVRPNLSKLSRVSMETAVHPDHIVYQETACRLQNITDEVNELKNTMVRLLSVKEAAFKAISEIEEQGESCGKLENSSEFVHDRKTETDEWASLSKKVDNLITAKPLGFKEKHKKFCESISSRIKNLSNGSKSGMTLGSESKGKVAKRISNLFLSTAPSNEKCIEHITALEGICTEVVKHTSELTDTLAEELCKRPRSEIPSSTVENIYICYESYVSGELMPLLYPVFEKCYKQKCGALTNSFSKKVLSETLIANINLGQDSNSATGKIPKNPATEELLQMFDSFVKSDTDERMSVFTKLRQLLEIIQFIVKKAKQMGYKANPTCTDDILDIIIPLLQKLDAETFLKIYANIVMLRNLRPNFAEGSRLQFALVSFSAAFQHLFDQEVLSKVSK